MGTLQKMVSFFINTFKKGDIRGIAYITRVILKLRFWKSDYECLIFDSLFDFFAT
jgi:hypothetical protein